MLFEICADVKPVGIRRGSPGLFREGQHSSWVITGPEPREPYADRRVIPWAVEAFAHDLALPLTRYGDVEYTIAAYEPASVDARGSRTNAVSSQLHAEPFRISATKPSGLVDRPASYD